MPRSQFLRLPELQCSLTEILRLTASPAVIGTFSGRLALALRRLNCISTHLLTPMTVRRGLDMGTLNEHFWGPS